MENSIEAPASGIFDSWNNQVDFPEEFRIVSKRGLLNQNKFCPWDALENLKEINSGSSKKKLILARASDQLFWPPLFYT